MPPASVGPPESITTDGFVAALPPGTRLAHAPGHVAARARLAVEIHVKAMRTGLDVTKVSWPASTGNRSGLSAAVRASLLGGSLHVALPAGSASAVQVVASQLGAGSPRRMAIGSGGGMRTIVERQDGPALLRIGSAGTPADPTRHYEGLGAVAHLPAVPEPLASGVEGELAWTLEAHVAGRQLRRLTPQVTDAASAFLTSLPSAPRALAPQRLVDESVLVAAGDAHSALRDLAGFMSAGLAASPGVLIHGDFWLGNLLFEDDRLAAVVDWDGWDPAGAPGTDLLHLHADHVRRRQRSNYGAVAAAMLWRSPQLRRQLATCLETHDLEPTDTLIDVLGIAWWITAVGTALRRNAAQLGDEWVERNVRRPARSLARRLL